MEKRTLIAIILSIAILIGYQYFFITPAPQQLVVEQETVKEMPKKEAVKPVLPSHPSKVAVLPERDIVIESDLYTATLTSKGGAIKSIALKKYKDKEGRHIILKADETIPALAMGSDEDFQFSNVNFSVSGSDIKLGPGMNKTNIAFEYVAGEYSIRRTYTFYNDSYGIDLIDEVSSPYMITLGRNFGIHERNESVHIGPVILKDAERIELDIKKLKEPKSFKEGVKWVAQEDKYFFSAIVPKTGIEDAKIWGKDSDAIVAIKMGSGANNYLIYAGPKEYDSLKGLGVGLEHIVDFGFFSILARPLFWLMKLFYSIIPNYGVVIILLTIIVRIPFIPIINKGQRSMKKLQDIQPRMAEIREKYKSDPQRMQKELMELYKKHKVNPMGGCLPLLLQIPVFFALYKVLMIAIELRESPFIFWIKDLSVKDPYYILPIIMGATMVIQQKMTPSTMDPTQQKIMMIMPVVFTFMFLTFPSGLVLYWLVNNILGIAQQWYMNKKLAKSGLDSE